jgi:hypothetical protein
MRSLTLEAMNIQSDEPQRAHTTSGGGHGMPPMKMFVVLVACDCIHRIRRIVRIGIALSRLRDAFRRTGRV